MPLQNSQLLSKFSIKPGIRIGFIVVLIGLTSCTKPNMPGSGRDGFPSRVPDLSKIPDARPKVEQLSKYGNPRRYRIGSKIYRVMKTSRGYKARGFASWYGTKFHGRRTSSGEKYDMFAMTAAHKFLPIPCYARVTSLDSGRSVIVKINDRGPFHSNRIIDLSYTAAAKLGILGRGTGRVEVVSIDPRDHRPGLVVPVHAKLTPGRARIIQR